MIIIAEPMLVNIVLILNQCKLVITILHNVKKIIRVAILWRFSSSVPWKAFDKIVQKL